MLEGRQGLQGTRQSCKLDTQCQSYSLPSSCPPLSPRCPAILTGGYPLCIKPKPIFPICPSCHCDITTNRSFPTRLTVVWRFPFDRRHHLASKPSGSPLSGDSCSLFSSSIPRAAFTDSRPVLSRMSSPGGEFSIASTGTAFPGQRPRPSGIRSSWSERLSWLQSL